MRDMLTILVRLIAFGAILLSTLAIGIGRWQRPEPSCRQRVGEVPVPIHNEVCGIFDRAARFLVPGHREVVSLQLPSGDALDRASVAPWRDGNGAGQVIGRWMSHTGRPGDLASRGVGLARFTFPGGEPLDRIETDTLPASPPCWLPGVVAQVLFVASDGHLYRLDFESTTGESVNGDPAGPRPEPLEWRVAGLPQDEVILSDPTWPADPRFGDTILVSLCRRAVRPDGRPWFQPARLWWLRLDEAHGAVVAAGALTMPEAPVGVEAHDRYPTVAVTRGGRCLLSFLTHGDGSQESTLRIAPLEFEGPNGPPRLAAAPTGIAERCLLSPLAFSRDGRSIACVTGGRRGGGAAGVRVVDLARQAGTLLAARPEDPQRADPGS